MKNSIYLAFILIIFCSLALVFSTAEAQLPGGGNEDGPNCNCYYDSDCKFPLVCHLGIDCHEGLHSVKPVLDPNFPDNPWVRNRGQCLAFGPHDPSWLAAVTLDFYLLALEISGTTGSGTANHVLVDHALSTNLTPRVQSNLRSLASHIAMLIYGPVREIGFPEPHRIGYYQPSKPISVEIAGKKPPKFAAIKELGLIEPVSKEALKGGS